MEIDYQKLRREQKISKLAGLPLLLDQSFRDEITTIKDSQREYISNPQNLILSLGRKQPIKSGIDYEFK